MAVEARRGCGFRKVGGIYLAGGGEGRPCGRLPIPLHVCQTCSQGIKPTRGWTWVDPGKLLEGAPYCNYDKVAPDVSGHGWNCASCPMRDPAHLAGENGRCGLLWVGESFYPTPAHFMLEARTLGMSRRLTGIPRKLKLGETWVLLAHRKAAATEVEDPETGEKVTVECGGVFYIWRPTRIEKIVTQSQSLNDEVMEKLARAGISPVVVPDDDSDHAGSVYDRAEEAVPA